MKQHADAAREAVIQYRLAAAWEQRGKVERALRGFRASLELEPGYVPAHLALGRLLLQQGRPQEAGDAFRQALEHAPGESELHKGLVDAWVEQGLLDAAFDDYRLARADNRRIRIGADDILCCVVVRNEALRLPYFLSYYREKGVARFLFVDNGSTDDTLPYLLEQPDVYVWRSDLSFNRANFGAGWFEPLLRRYGQEQWCLIVDADELLYYPDCERKSLTRLCWELDARAKRAFSAVLLDMYSDRAVRDTHYARGQSFLDVCPYFDRQFYHATYENAGPYRNQVGYVGGARQRMFGAAGDYYLSKVPLIKYGADVVLAGGQHWTSLPAEEIAEESGALLHFKYFSTFVDYVSREVERQEHYGGALQYGEYARGLAQDGALTFYDPQHSIRLEDSAQLVRLGVMRADSAATERPAVEFPPIAPLPNEGDRPSWSVMITAYRRTQFVERALRSVLEQAPGPDEMQIEVVSDGGDPAVQDEIAAIVAAVGGGRAHFHRLPENAGHPRIFNVCIERARGRWVHILHDDDWVRPGFYAALRAGLEARPDLGAAFSRHIYVDGAGEPLRESWLERDTPGVIENWLERIAVSCRLQCPAIAVKREAYERLGGYCPEARSAFDWEMWTRIAVHYPVWFEPAALACFREGAGAESYGLLGSGGQVADSLRCIEIARTYLPPASAEGLARRARERLAAYALDVAGRQLKAGNHRAAIANMRAGLKCSRSERIQRTLASLLLEHEGEGKA